MESLPIGVDELVWRLEDERYQSIQSLIRCFKSDRRSIIVISNLLEAYVLSTLFHSQSSRDSESRTDDEIFGDILSVWRKFDMLLYNLFDEGSEDAFVVKAMQRPFINLIRTPPKNLNMEVKVVDHCNALLSTNGEQKQVLEVSRLQELKHLISFSRLFPQSDVLIELYSVMLANRLLLGTSDSYQMELIVTQELFKNFSSKVLGLKSLLKDVSMWHKYQYDIMDWSIQNSNTEFNQGSLATEPKIIRSLQWPNLRDVELKIPMTLQKIKCGIQEFFHNKHPSKEVFVHSWGGRVIIKTFLWDTKSSKGVRLSLTTGQICILSLFEREDMMSIQNIMDKLQIKNYRASSSRDSKDYGQKVMELLNSMMNVYPVLVKQPNTAEIETWHTIILNKKFKPHEALIKLPSPKLFSNDKDEKLSNDVVVTKVCQEYIQAAVMKIMKDRREISQKELVNLVIKRLSMFTAHGIQVEKCIWDLILQEYLELDQDLVKYVP